MNLSHPTNNQNSDELPQELLDAIWTNAMSSQSALLVVALVKQQRATWDRQARIAELRNIPPMFGPYAASRIAELEQPNPERKTSK